MTEFARRLAQFTGVAACALLAAAPAAQTQAPAGNTAKVATPRTADGRPDLSGVWVAGPPGGQVPPAGDGKTVQVYLAIPGLDPNSPTLFKEMDKVTVERRAASANKPLYKPEHQAKVKELSDLQAKLDPAFYCRIPGIPRMGPPTQIIQTAGQVVFLYSEQNAFRVIPTDGRAHRTDVEPSYLGDSVARWDGDTLVVDVTQTTEDTWLGSDGYFHSPRMRIVERIQRDGNTLRYAATVEDADVLAQPWVMPTRTLRLSADPADLPIEGPPCIEQSAKHMLTNEHH
jgi:hypothetical protein